jgi:hypothetical protein
LTPLQSAGPFVLLSADRSTGPSSDNDWVHYQIGQGTNVIDGYRRGDFATVRLHLETVVVALNERRALRRGRVGLPAPVPKAPSS